MNYQIGRTKYELLCDEPIFVYTCDNKKKESEINYSKYKRLSSKMTVKEGVL